MYESHYDYIKNKYDNKSKLLFADTDSLMYEINAYEDCISDKIFLISVIIQNTKINQIN